MLKIPVSRMEELLLKLSETNTVYAPIEVSGIVKFDKWAPESAVRLDCLLTTNSIKNFFFLDVENIAAFSTNRKEIEIKDIRKPTEPFVVFGARACDAESLNLLDRVFLSEPVDTFYQSRRQNGVVITLACSAPEETCFCRAFDVDTSNPSGDIATWLVNDELYWKSFSQKGDRLTESVKNLFEEADGAAVEKQKNETAEIFKKLPFGDLNLKKPGKETLMEKFDSPEWGKLFNSCIACGICTFICPTCHCYDIQDFNTGSEIRRFRCWDSCMNVDFTQMAHGNPRPSRLERFRQRYMHKLVYFPESNDGVFACVGCGRCVRKCPVSMNIVKVAKALEGKDDVQ